MRFLNDYFYTCGVFINGVVALGVTVAFFSSIYNVIRDLIEERRYWKQRKEIEPYDYTRSSYPPKDQTGASD